MIHSPLEKCARVSHPIVNVSKTVSVAVDIIYKMAFDRNYSDEEAHDNKRFEFWRVKFVGALESGIALQISSHGKRGCKRKCIM